MNLVWLVSILVVCIQGSAEAASRPPVMNVGAMFAAGSINGKVLKIAIEAAGNDVNADPSILGKTKLSISFHDSNYSGFLGLIGALRYMESDTFAILGPQNSVMAHILAHLANELRVPLLSVTALDPTQASLQHPYFVQTAPNGQFQMAAIADIVSYFGWSEAVAIFTDDDNSRNGVAALGDKLAEKRHKISYKAVLPPDPTSTREDVKKLLIKVRMMESRVIILHTFSKSGLLVFDVAKELGMMESGYVWIATTWLSTVLDSTSPLSSKTASSIQGALTLRPHTPDSKRKRDFISRWNELSNGSIGLNPYGLYAYDTVWMLAHAIDLLLEQGGSIAFSNITGIGPIGGLKGGTLNLGALSIFRGGKQLLDNILRTNTTGLTGPVAFHPDRSLLNPPYEIINTNENGYQRTGYWSNYSGTSLVPPEKLFNLSKANHSLDTVLWPGGTTVKPRGWVFPNNGERLRIGVPNRVSLRDFVSRASGTDVVEGYCIEIFVAAIKLLPYAVPYKFVLFGDGLKNPSYNELVNMVASGQFDAAVGDIAIVTNRTKTLDFTQPYIESGLVVVAPVRGSNSAWTFLKPFSSFMWGVTVFFFLVIGLVIWILEHRKNNEFRGPPRKQVITIYGKFSFSTMFFAHRENIVSTLGRTVLIIWLFVVLVINSSYTASLTSMLTIQQLSSPITGIDTLITSTEPIGFQIGSFAQSYLVEQLNIPKSRLVPLGSPEAYATALKDKTVAAVVDERAYIELFLSENCKFSIRGSEFTKSGWGFNGDLQRIYNKWLSRKICASETSDIVSDQLQLQSFWGLFLIASAVCFIALLIHLFSMLRQDTKSKRSKSKRKRNESVVPNVIEKEGDRSVRSASKRKQINNSQEIPLTFLQKPQTPQLLSPSSPPMAICHQSPFKLFAAIPSPSSKPKPLHLRCSLSLPSLPSRPPLTSTEPEPVFASVKAFAPATVANLGPGFDFLGCAVDGLGDFVSLTLDPQVSPGEISISEISGDHNSKKLSKNPLWNCAGIAAIEVMKMLGVRSVGLSLTLEKGLPLGSGLGSSAASAAAAAVAVNEFFGGKLGIEELVIAGLKSEEKVSGYHADNIAPAIMGGFVLIRSYEPLDLIPLIFPDGKELFFVLATPEFEAPTKKMRAALPAEVGMAHHVWNSSQAGALVAAVLQGDLPGLGRALSSDKIVEPRRAPLIPGMDAVKKAAIEAGAFGCTISGAGPTAVAVTDDPEKGKVIGEKMVAAFLKEGMLKAAASVSRLDRVGARLLVIKGSSWLLAECAICLMEFVDGDVTGVLPYCCHGFHVSCVDRWLQCNSSCPSSRALWLWKRGVANEVGFELMDSRFWSSNRERKM
ncbi:glutamate receptor 3.2-like [Pyrus ussuriensis x Pyrus communis]|uniref:Homoserine kinase n=1 Tax=Pyrus ussuriensis x Pyrus communis TaxID=2448454 RepID=A0A5N5FHE0_9ROSA|nr:glutamate receptor 3.2-like [Pyrus ussuriensis x Pyrus communis]